MADGHLHRLSGPVVHAATDAPIRVSEAVLVGGERLLGEVIRVGAGEAVIQVYEDTTGLMPGAPVERTGAPLSVPLGPGLLGGIFDGLLRPLGRGGERVEPGMRRAAIERRPFRPTARLGEVLEPGATFGEVGPPGGRPLPCRVPPDARGEVVRIVDEGEHAEDAPLCALRDDAGGERTVAMIERWPVRRPRPVRARLPADQPLLTGQRALDTLFPIARGGRASLPGGFGTGKTVLLETLAKHTDADVVVYVGCGERGNEMASALHHLARLDDPRTGRALLERTVIIANTSNMPVAAREASIYTGITVAEHFRDLGMHVLLTADSTSRWAEALREVSGRLGELPAEGGYPAYLSSRLADFYERAGRVRTLCGDEGSVTIVGAVSPPSGDFSEPVTSHTQRYVRALWSLDPSRARARLYPAIHPLESYSGDVEALAAWWESRIDPRWAVRRAEVLSLLEENAHVERMARIVGKDALPARQRLVLSCAEVVNDGFLRQSALSEIDARCSPERQAAMLRVMVRFVMLGRAAVDAGTPVEQIVALPVLRRLRRMGEEIGDDEVERIDELERELEAAIEALEPGRAAGPHRELSDAG